MCAETLNRPRMDRELRVWSEMLWVRDVCVCVWGEGGVRKPIFYSGLIELVS